MSIPPEESDEYMYRRHLILILALIFSAINVSAQIYDDDGMPIPYQPVKEELRFDGKPTSHFKEWAKEHQVYPRKALKLGLEGRVSVSFTITEEGELVDVKVLRGVHKVLDEASVRLIKSSSGRWTPATQSGKPIKQFCLFPVIWELPEEDIVVSTEYDKVYDEFHYVAKMKDFCSGHAYKEYSEERYGSHKYYEEVRNEAYKEAIRNIDSRKMGAFIYSFIPDKHKRKLGNQGWGFIVFNLSKTEGLLKYSLTIRADEGIKVGRIFTKDDCLNIFHALDTSIFNSWDEDIDYLTGAIKFRLQDTD